MEELLKLIGNYGFPMALSIYLLVRFETKISQMTVALTSLVEAVNMWGAERKGRANNTGSVGFPGQQQ